MAAVVIINDGRGLRIEPCCINQPNKITFLLNSCIQATRQNTSVIKVGAVCMGVGISRHLKEELAWAIDKRLQLICYLKQLYH